MPENTAREETTMTTTDSFDTELFDSIADAWHALTPFQQQQELDRATAWNRQQLAAAQEAPVTIEQLNAAIAAAKERQLAQIGTDAWDETQAEIIRLEDERYRIAGSHNWNHSRCR